MGALRNWIDLCPAAVAVGVGTEPPARAERGGQDPAHRASADESR